MAGVLYKSKSEKEYEILSFDSIRGKLDIMSFDEVGGVLSPGYLAEKGW